MDLDKHSLYNEDRNTPSPLSQDQVVHTAKPWRQVVHTAEPRCRWEVALEVIPVPEASR
jgi:hypothetical protein